MAAAASAVINGRYIPLKVLGRGTMGVVYKAFDKLNRSEVALKRVPFKLGEAEPVPIKRTGSATLADQATALAREFQLLATLRHPNIISVLDYGFDSTHRPYLVMDLLDNAVAVTQRSASFGNRQNVDLLLQLLSALDYLHWRGVVHHDIKPNNVLVLPDGRLKVLDFGLAMLLNRPEEVSGTPAYLPPEVILSDNPSELDHCKIDLYEVGVLAYEMITGSLPFFAEDLGLLAEKILYQEPEVEITGILAPVIGRLLAKDPAQRFDSAREVMLELCHLIDVPPLLETNALRESFLQTAQLIGREAELAHLSDEMDRALGGQGKAWLISGESGVGKSRLIDELAVRALVTGALVLRGQAVRESGTAYQLWRSVFRRLCLAVEVTEHESRILKLLISDIDVLLERAVPNPDLIDAKNAQERLLAVTSTLMQKYTAPMVILIEDLQWADQESKILLKRLIQLVPEKSLLIVGTRRDDETSDASTSPAGMQLLRLHRLSDEAIALLCESILGKAGRRPDLVSLLQRETEGNVFFLVELLRALAASAGELAAVGQLNLPLHITTPNIQESIGRRLSNVPKTFRSLLDYAAILGRQIDLQVLHHLKSEIDLDHWLMACANAAVIEVHDGAWRFAHDKVREQILDALPQGHRPQLHRQVAIAIEKTRGDQAAPILTYHWEMAGDWEKTVYYSARAGEVALQHGASQDALHFFERALKIDRLLCGDKANRTRSLQWADWLRFSGEAYLWTGNVRESYNHLLQALQTADYPNPQKLSDILRHLTGALLTQMIHRLRWPNGNTPHAAMRTELLAVATIYLRLTEVNYYLGNNGQMLFTTFASLNLAEQAGQLTGILVGAYGNTATAVAYIGQGWLAKFYANRGRIHADRLQEPYWLGYGLTRAILALMHYISWEDIIWWGETALDVEKQVGAERHWRETAALLSIVYFWQGNLGRAIDLLEGIYTSAKASADTHYLSVGIVWRIAVLTAYGRFQDAHNLMSAAEEVLGPLGKHGIVNVDTMRGGLGAQLYLYTKQPQAALETALACAEIIARAPTASFSSVLGISATLETLLELSAQAADNTQATTIKHHIYECLKKLRDFQHHSRIGKPYYARLAGMLAWREGQTRHAMHLWNKGLNTAKSLEMPLEAARLHLTLARYLPNRSFTAQKHREDGIHLLREIGAEGFINAFNNEQPHEES